jgi:Protein of unknown function (DUF3048) N-terminal domain/Protein of unknown function (DUF3048) C-terminal domain
MPGWVPDARAGRSVLVALMLSMTLTTAAAVVADAPVAHAAGRVGAGGVLRVNVPEAVGGKTVVGQLTVDQVGGRGFVTAYACEDGLPTDASGAISRSDLNYDATVSPVASNRLIVQADEHGDVCFYTLRPAALIVDVNGTSFDTGISSFPNRRTDTRLTAPPSTSPITTAGGVLRVNVPEAAGRRTVVGQLTVDQARAPGYVTAFPCDAGIPTDERGVIGRSDLNYDSNVSPVASNRLIVEADADGDVCFFTLTAVALIVDLNGVSDVGIASFANARTDTRARPEQTVQPGGVLRVNVPQAVGRRTVIGQLTVDRATDAGFVTAYGCADGLPADGAGTVSRSDLNYDGSVSPVASNRLVVQADASGDVCFSTLRSAAIVVDVNGVSDIGIQSFPNRRTDTRLDGSGILTGPGGPEVPVWAPYTPRPALDGLAALSGRPAGPEVSERPILAVKIDNYSRARPQFALDQADAVIEENVEGVTRFVALFHTNLPPEIGPVRSARTGDLDLLAAMNRPVFAYSGANAGVSAWLDSATSSGVLSDFSALRNGCYRREAARPGPHNLLLDPNCAMNTALVSTNPPGPATPLWRSDGTWTPGLLVSAPDTSFAVPMDGVHVEWTWDVASGRYLRFQDGAPHVTAAGAPIAADTVVEVRAVHVPSPVDARSPNPITVGTGSATVHRDGRAYTTVWSRPTAQDPFVFVDPVSGTSIPLDVGTTFVHLVRSI